MRLLNVTEHRLMFLVIVLLLAGAAFTTAQTDPAVEKRIVDYLKNQVESGKPVIVSELYGKVFPDEEERKALDRLFNVFFKIPIFVAQYKAATDSIPTLDDIARQFNLQIPGEVEVLLSIMENDPRIPDFIARDPKSGEIIGVDVEAVRSDKRFNQVIERTLAGWLGQKAPPFELDLVSGGKIGSADLAGKSHLIYFWYSACPPCVRTSPYLVDLYERFGKNDFTIVAVNADRFLELTTTDAERASYIKEQGILFHVAHLNKQMQEDYGNINVYPTFFLVDSRGIIRKHHIGYQPLRVLESDIEQLLKDQ
jgi:peroxiredoxin